MRILKYRVMAGMAAAGLIIAGILAGQPAAAASTNYHVAKNGNDNNPGTSQAPFLTIQKGADVAEAGDTVIVHGGIYREWVIPKNSGTATAPITFTSAPGVTAIIKGSEEINTWSNVGGNVWRVVLNNSFFNGYNPFNINYAGNALHYGQEYHLGRVYLNDNPSYREVFSQAAVDANPETWYASVAGGNTTIWANFNGANPNTNLAEINVRQQVFGPYGYPDETGMLGIDYITVKRFYLAQAAPQWGAPPNPDLSPASPPQGGLINTYWSKGWVIENNIIRDSSARCVVSTVHWNDEGFNGHDQFRLGSAPGWGWQNLGQHIVQDNLIRNCQQAGVHGQKSWVGSTIQNNVIEDINNEGLIGGAETAGIKILVGIDVTIKNNIIRRVHFGENAYRHPAIWIDFSNQGTRITGNVIYDIDDPGEVLHLERNHGPILVDNNIIEAPGPDAKFLFNQSEHVVFVHNLTFGNQIGTNDSVTPTSWTKHTTKELTRQPINLRDDKYYNNIFIHGNQIPMSNPGYEADCNVYYETAVSNPGPCSIVNGGFNANLNITGAARSVTVTFNANTAPQTMPTPVVNPSLAGTNFWNGQSIEDRLGNGITIDTDILGNARDSTPTAGPLESTINGTNQFTLDAGPDWFPGA